jgi:hypothetical protein
MSIGYYFGGNLPQQPTWLWSNATLAVRTEVSDRTVTVGDMLLFDRLHRCAGGPRALCRRHQCDSSDDLGIRSARQLSITTATINGYRYGGCCAAVSRGRLTGPQSCEAFFTFRGAEPLCIGGRGPSAVEVAASPPAVHLWPELALQLHQAPDLGPVGADVGLDVGGRLLDGSQVDAKELRAPLQRCRDRPAQVRVVPSPHRDRLAN